MFKKILGGLAAALFLAISPASAAIITSTWTGTFGNGVDPTGIFGTPGGSLVGAQFEIIYRFDTNWTRLISIDTPDGELASSRLPVGFTGLTATVNGVSHDFVNASPSAQHDLMRSLGAPGTPFEYREYYVYGSSYVPGGPGYGLYAYMDIDPAIPFSKDFLDPFTVAAGEGATYGAVEFQVFDYGIDASAVGDLRLAVTVSGVPEPAAWAMMILGFGAAGSALRANRRRPGLAAS